MAGKKRKGMFNAFMLDVANIMKGARGLSVTDSGGLRIAKAEKVTEEVRAQAAEFAARSFAAFTMLQPAQTAIVSTALGGGAGMGEPTGTSRIAAWGRRDPTPSMTLLPTYSSARGRRFTNRNE